MSDRKYKSGPDHPDCDSHRLAMECHDTEKDGHVVLLDLDQVTVYKTIHRCSIEGCTGTWKIPKFAGRKPWTTDEFESVMYQLYENFYENPRDISHKILMDLIPYPEPYPTNPLSKYLAAAVDEGSKDGLSGAQKLSKDELIELIGWNRDE